MFKIFNLQIQLLLGIEMELVVVVEAMMEHFMKRSHWVVDIVVDFVVEMMDRNGEMRYQTMVIRNWLKEAVIL